MTKVVVSRVVRPTMKYDGRLQLDEGIPVLSEDNEVFIFMSRRDVEAKNWYGKAQAYVPATGQYGPVTDLQVFFKWYHNLMPTTLDEFNGAIAKMRVSRQENLTRKRGRCQ